MTQRSNRNVNQIFLNNLMWFGASLALAFFVWIIASTQADPISEQRFRSRIPVQVALDDNMTVTDQQTTNVWVLVRAQESVQEELTAEDIIVEADLVGFEPGTHTVELQTELARRGVADTQPRQITLTIEEVISQQVPVEVFIPDGLDLPPNFTSTEPTFSENQVAVSGVASLVQQVVAARATLDLRDQRDTLVTDVRLTPIDADGLPVTGVTVDPQLTELTVDIRQREDLMRVSVSPDVDPSTLPAGYTLSSWGYEPQTVFLIGSQEQLAEVQTPLTTNQIDFTGRTEDFEVTVPVLFPDGEEYPILGEQSITLFFEIRAQTITEQFENEAVTIIGLDDPDWTVELAPDNVVVLVTGPQPVVEELDEENEVQVFVDLAGLEPGTHDLMPTATIAEPSIDDAGVSINPATITVTIIDPNQPTLTPGG